MKTLVRPNGKAYRPRKGVRVVGWDSRISGFNDDYGVLVLGTHDLDRARHAAFLTRYNEEDQYPVNPTVGWWRNSFGYGGDPWWVEDPARGMAGVMWTYVEDKPKVWLLKESWDHEAGE